MEKNVGKFDGKIRSRLGWILALLGILGIIGLVNFGTTVSVILLVVAFVLVVTGQTKKCGLYSALDVDTLEEDQE